MRYFVYLFVVMFGLLYSSQAFTSVEKYTPAEIQLMHQIYQQQNSDISLSQTRYRLYENQFLLSEAQRLMPDKVARLSDVGFTTGYHVERYLNNLFIKQLHLPPTIEASNNVKHFTASWLTNTLGEYPANGQYSETQKNTLNLVKLEHFAFPALSVYDFIKPLSMQIRFRLHQGDNQLFQAEIAKKHQYFINLEKATNAFKAKDINIDNLISIAQGDILRPSIQSWLGVKDMMHGQSPILEQLEKQVSEQQINQYYQANKSRFKYLYQITAQGAEFKNRTDAVKFKNEVTKSTFKAALKAANMNDIYSKFDNNINREHKKEWVVQLAFTQNENELSEVIRSPAGLWVVVLTNDYEYRYFAATGQTVRYQAIKSVALQNAHQQYQQKWAAWHTQNEIKL
ncbi:peptidylprolyl isomerase [Pseudoalteromonas sp.]|uniref:peptidylprolyl isomerase n=1 Tax=Pseudoalteromonas sp. TaxID=53249 RepID=UPI0023565DD7|nr:peptidylprolyl isomerase [Pseudoalteromonas sp.]